MAKAEAALVELVIQNRLDHVQNRPLDDSVADRRNAQRSGFVRPSRLGNLNSPDRRGSIGAAFELFAELACFHDQVLFKRCAGLPIDAACTVFAGHLAGRHVQVQFRVNLVNQRVPFASFHLVFQKCRQHSVGPNGTLSPLGNLRCLSRSYSRKRHSGW
jgi:hypothetical protein